MRQFSPSRHALQAIGRPRPQRLGERAFVEIVELAADRKAVRQLGETNRKFFQPLGEVMGGGLALQGGVHRQHHLVDAAGCDTR